VKRKRSAFLVLLAVAGSGAAGFLLGRGERAPDPPPRHAAPTGTVEPGIPAPRLEVFGEAPEPRPPPPSPESIPAGEPLEPIDASKLAEALARDPASPYAPTMLDALVAQAASNGRAMLPRIRELLDSGVDVKLTSFRQDGSGYPTLRLALLEAAAATGDPDAAQLLGDVARTSPSPLEVVFSAHLIDRLEGMDPATARLALGALTATFSDAERKALGPVLRQVGPAAARADPGFAESFLLERLRQPGDTRLLMPALDGLAEERARQVVLSALSAPDVPDPAKASLATQAASTRGAEVLEEVRRAIETHALPTKAVAATARSAVNGPAFGRLERDAKRAMKSGDLALAERLADGFQRRLVEARAILAAARGRDVGLPAELDKQGSILEDRLERIRLQIARARQKPPTPR